MKKGVLITLLVALLLVLAVPVALALTDSQKTELESLYRQEHELRLQILEKQKEAGLIDEEQAEFFREKMEQRWQYRQERMAEGDYRFGMRGRGPGRGCGNRPFDRPEL
jgi:type II secretory pathway component PulK